MTVAERLMEACEAETIADVANRLQVPHPTARNYIAEGRLPATEILIRIANETGVSISWLLFGLGPKFLGTEQATAIELPLHIRQLIQKVAEASEVSFQQALEELLNRQLALMGDEYDLGDTITVPVFQSMADDLFDRMAQLNDEERKKETERMIGALMVRAATKH